MKIDNTQALALASHALLVKLIAVMKRDGLINEQQLSTAFLSAIRMLEKDADATDIQATLFLEGLHEELCPSSEPPSQT